jgi:hypothetical protein
MDLIEFRRSLRRHARASLVVAILVLGFGVASTGGPRANYAATSTVLVTPRAERFQLASASVLRVILPNVIVVARSDSLRSAAASHVQPAYTRTPISVDAAFDSQASTLFLTTQSKDANAAVAWSDALARALTERMKNDKYLVAQVLDVAQGAVLTGRRVRVLGIAASFGLALLAFVLVAFGMQRLEESRDVTGALRRRGVRVLGSVAASRRRRWKADQLSVIRAALVPDDEEDGRVLVTALSDESLSRWLADRLDEGADLQEVRDEMWPRDRQLETVEFPERASERGLSAIASPLVEQLCLRATLEDWRACVVAVDDRMSSVADVVSGVKMLEHAGIACRGVVLIHGARYVRRSKSREKEIVS